MAVPVDTTVPSKVLEDAVRPVAPEKKQRVSRMVQPRELQWTELQGHESP